ncbi:MAG: DNA methyltransferase [Promethearchaeota archaeon]
MMIPQTSGDWREIIAKIDWDFVDADTTYSTHSFHSYPAKFIPNIPHHLIKLFSKPKELVLDPFCGSGTSCLEALFLGREAIGVDLNPLAILISKVKTTPLNKHARLRCREILKEIEQKCQETFNNKKTINQIEERPDIKTLGLPKIRLPNRLISTKFTQQMIRILTIIKNGIDTINDQDIQDFFMVAFSSVIRTVIESKSRKKTEIIVNFRNKVHSMLRTMASFFMEVEPILKTGIKIPQIIKHDARHLEFVPTSSIDLVVTSPPYINALDYYRVHQFNMAWLGFDWKPFKEHEIGCHSQFINNRFRLLSKYLADMFRVFIEIKRTLKPNAFCCIVIGNSCLEYEIIESHKHFAAMGNRIGLKWQKSEFRQINVKKKYSSKPIGNINNEYIVILKKTDEKMYSNKDEGIILEFVKKRLLDFKKHILVSNGTCLRGKTLSEQRIAQNKRKYLDAIQKCHEDIKI